MTQSNKLLSEAVSVIWTWLIVLGKKVAEHGKENQSLLKICLDLEKF